MEKSIKIFLCITFAIVFSFFKFSFVWGSVNFFFSGINFIVPVVGALLGLPISCFLILLFFISKQILFGQILTLGLPTFIATLNIAVSAKVSKFSQYSKLCLSLILPVVCMILFILHPVGRVAALYSFYWFIPMVICILQLGNRLNSFFYTALQSTFIAHAVGSIFWLYAFSMPSQYWLALMPIVAIERLIFACGITLSVECVKKILKYKFVNYTTKITE